MNEIELKNKIINLQNKEVRFSSSAILEVGKMLGYSEVDIEKALDSEEFYPQDGGEFEVSISKDFQRYIKNPILNNIFEAFMKSYPSNNNITFYWN